MPRFSEETVDKYLDDFFQSLPDNDKYQQREVGGVYYALLDDSFREEIASPMEDVKILVEEAEKYIESRLAEDEL